MDTEKSMKVIEKAKNKAEQLGVSAAFAVFNSEQVLVLFHRMNETPELSVQLALAKALTALKIGCDTEKVSHLVKKNDGILRNIRYETSISLIGGGKLIFSNGKIIGAMGVSGGTEAQDVEIASTSLSDYRSN